MQSRPRREQGSLVLPAAHLGPGLLPQDEHLQSRHQAGEHAAALPGGGQEADGQALRFWWGLIPPAIQECCTAACQQALFGV